MLSSAAIKKKQSQILNVARELFLERGYDAVSLDDILERAGGSKTTLYSYYGGKEGLFTAMVQQVCSNKLGEILALDVTALDPKTGLNLIGNQILKIIAEQEGRLIFRAMIAEASRFPKLAEAFMEAGPNSMIRAVRGNIEYWQKQGMLRAGNPEFLATQFLGIMMADFHTKSLLGLLDPMSGKQANTWVSKGTELFLEGALPPAS